jgi:GntR family transcriptional regulator
MVGTPGSSVSGSRASRRPLTPRQRGAAIETRTPHYLRIYRELKRRIEAGSLRSGERLETQRALAQAFGVTVMTVRQALQLLEQEGLVVAQQGSGTFVAPKRVSYDMANLRSLAQEISEQGLPLTTRVLRHEFVSPHPRVVELLGLGPGEAVYLIERLRLIDGEPVVLQDSQLQPWLGETLADTDLTRVSLYDHLTDMLGIEIARAHETLRATSLKAAEASLLGEEPGAAALLSERLTYSGGGDVIIHDRALMAGDRLAVSADRFPSDISVGYRLRLDGNQVEPQVRPVTSRKAIQASASPSPTKRGTK